MSFASPLMFQMSIFKNYSLGQKLYSGSNLLVFMLCTVSHRKFFDRSVLREIGWEM